MYFFVSGERDRKKTQKSARMREISKKSRDDVDWSKRYVFEVDTNLEVACFVEESKDAVQTLRAKNEKCNKPSTNSIAVIAAFRKQ